MKLRLLYSIFWIGGFLASLIALLWFAGTIIFNPKSPRARSLYIAFDQLANAATGGSEDMTISSRAAYAAEEGKRWAIILCHILNKLDPGHCERSKGI